MVPLPSYIYNIIRRIWSILRRVWHYSVHINPSVPTGTCCCALKVIRHYDVIALYIVVTLYDVVYNTEHCLISLSQWRIQRESPGTFAHSKIRKKISVIFSLFVHIWWLKCFFQNFLGSIRSPALFSNFIKVYISSLKRLEMYNYYYILRSFNMATTLPTWEGNIDFKGA